MQIPCSSSRFLYIVHSELYHLLNTVHTGTLKHYAETRKQYALYDIDKR